MKMKNKNNKFLIPQSVAKLSVGLCLLGAFAATAQSDFPFSAIPQDNSDGSFNTTININGGTTNFNNLLLGSRR